MDNFPEELWPEFGPGQLIPEEVLRSYLAFCGKGVRIYRGCRIIDPERVHVGDFSQIDQWVWIVGGQGVWIGRYVHLAFGSSISGGGRCYIGDFVGIGSGVRIITGTDLVDGSGLTNPTVPLTLRSVQRGEVRIEAHALIFTGSIVFPNVTIGEGAVVGAGSIVHKDLEPWSIYAGQPLVRVGRRPRDKILKLAEQLLQGKQPEPFSLSPGQVAKQPFPPEGTDVSYPEYG